MKVSRRLWLLALLLVVALVGASCGDDDDDGGDGGSGDESTLPSVPAGSTMEKIQQNGKLVVGVKFDQPGFGLKDPATGGDPVGFDVEIGKLVAESIFGDNISGKVEFKEAKTPVREIMIQNGDVDIVVATYTINDNRKRSVAFAGPYFVSEQDIMVKSTDETIKSVEDLNGKKVCSVQGSTSLTNVRAKAPRADTSITFGTYSECAAAMADNRVQAVTTDSHILEGLAKTSNGQFKVIKAPFSQEPYGIGLKKGDPDFRNFINDLLEKLVSGGDYKTAFDRTLGAQGVPYKAPPTPDRYTETGEVVPVTTTVPAGGAATTTSTTR
jgi:glutamate transport system substrate-binding protein